MSNSVCNRIRDWQIRPPLCGRPILLITRMIKDQIGLHSVLLPLFIISLAKREKHRNDKCKSTHTSYCMEICLFSTTTFQPAWWKKVFFILIARISLEIKFYWLMTNGWKCCLITFNWKGEIWQFWLEKASRVTNKGF